MPRNEGFLVVRRCRCANAAAATPGCPGATGGVGGVQPLRAVPVLGCLVLFAAAVERLLRPAEGAAAVLLPVPAKSQDGELRQLQEQSPDHQNLPGPRPPLLICAPLPPLVCVFVNKAQQYRV